MINQIENNEDTCLRGNVRALLGEYRKAIDELIITINTLNENQLCKVVDQNTPDDDCRSIQSVLSHVVRSGYGYIIYIENYLGSTKPRLEKVYFNNVNRYTEHLNLMFEYSQQFFIQNPKLEIEQLNTAKKILVNWGQTYDIEQLMEHAIVHVLRHRRQIERFINIQRT